MSLDQENPVPKDPLPKKYDSVLAALNQRSINRYTVDGQRLTSDFQQFVHLDPVEPLRFLEYMGGFLPVPDENRAYTNHLKELLGMIHAAYEQAREQDSFFDPMDDATFLKEKGIEELSPYEVTILSQYVDFIRERTMPKGRHRKESEVAKQVLKNTLYPDRSTWTIDNL